MPKLPSPRDLQPFPTAEVLQFRGHTDVVRSCDFDPSGQYVVSGSEDGTLKGLLHFLSHYMGNLSIGSLIAFRHLCSVGEQYWSLCAHGVPGSGRDARVMESCSRAVPGGGGGRTSRAATKRAGGRRRAPRRACHRSPAGRGASAARYSQ